MPKPTPTGVYVAWLLCLPLGAALAGAPQTPEKPVTRQETLRGTITPEREWWDVLHYDLSVQFLPETRSIRGSNVITFKTLKAGSRMQIDLQAPLTITKVTHAGADLKFEREGNVYWVTFDKELPAGVEDKVDDQLRRPANRGKESALGRRRHVGPRRPRQLVHQDDLRGHRRQHLVAEQGHRL